MYPRNDEGFARAFADVRWSVRTHKRSYKLYVGRLEQDRYTLSMADITPPRSALLKGLQSWSIPTRTS